MSCTDKITRRCKKVYAACTDYQTALPEFSTLTDCVSIEETTAELYELVGEIKTELDLTALDADCLTLPTTPNLVNVLQLFITTFCAMETQISELQSDVATLQSQVTALQEGSCP